MNSIYINTMEGGKERRQAGRQSLEVGIQSEGIVGNDSILWL